MELNKGNLVKQKVTGELGIITSTGHRQGKAIVFWGDGLESETTLDNLEPVLFHPTTQIVADFTELVGALDRDRGYRHVYPSV